MKQFKISIVGAGAVGSTSAYALIMQNIEATIMLVDCDETRCSGEVYDLVDALPFYPQTKIVQGDLKTAAQADVVILAAGKRQTQGQERSDLLADNARILHSIITDMKPFAKDTLIMIVTNPVDILASVVARAADLPINHIFATGTFLDTQRIQYELGQQCAISSASFDCMVLGEHGPTSFIPWSLARVNGLPLETVLTLDEIKRKKLEEFVHSKAQEIIVRKQATYFGIAACVAKLCAIIHADQKAIVPLSAYHKDKDIFISVPVILGRSGIVRIMQPPLISAEHEQFEQSCITIKNQHTLIKDLI